jgi:hypothetical protein
MKREAISNKPPALYLRRSIRRTRATSTTALAKLDKRGIVAG